LKAIRRIYAEFRKWRNNWDDLCSRCGQCCYLRSLSRTGKVVIDYNTPCVYLDEKTHLCRVFEDRFRICDSCQKVNFIRALFFPFLPSNCAYAQTFRVWLKKQPEKSQREGD